MSWRVKVKRCKRVPAGWELLEPSIEDFERQMREAVEEEHEGKRKCESAWPIHRIHWLRNRFIYNNYYRDEKISKECYEWLVRLKIADGELISKWRKPGYEILCSTAVISKSTNFGTTSICRVPVRLRSGNVAPCVTTGCVSCASGDGFKGGPIWWCDPRPNFAQVGGGTSQSGGGQQAKKRKVDDAGAGGGSAAAAAAEPEVDEELQKRIDALK